MFLSIFLYGQKFVLTPDGVVNSGEPEKDYIVMEFDGLSQTELYQKTELFTTDLMFDPKEAISFVEYEVIKISGFQENAIRRNKYHAFDLRYTLTFKFKDGKIRIDTPTMEMTAFNQHEQTLHVQHKADLAGFNIGIYNPEGTLKSKMAKLDLETFFNTIVDNLAAQIVGKEDDEW